MITRKNINKSYLSKKKRNRNRNKNNRVKQSGGAVSNVKLKERLNFFNEFSVDEVAAEVKIIETQKDIIKVDISSGMTPEPILDIKPDNTILTYVDLHGSLNGNLLSVPEKTIICFLTPIDEAFVMNTVKDDDDMDNMSFKFIDNLNYNQFDKIIKGRECLNIMEDSKNYNKYGLVYYNCFKNSTWYYPGDIFPDVSIQAQRSDYTTDHLGRTRLNYPYINETVDIECDSSKKIITKKYNSSFFKKTESLDLSNKEYFMKVNADLDEDEDKYEDYLDNDSIKDTVNSLVKVTDKYRIIIICSCRNFNKDISNYDKLLNLRMELYYQTSNKYNVDKDLFDCLDSNSLDDIIPISASEKDYYYSPLLENHAGFIKYEDLNNFDKFKQAYGGKVNSLMRLQDKFKLTKTFEQEDYAYLCSFSLTQIILFLSNIVKIEYVAAAGADAAKKYEDEKKLYEKHWSYLLTISRFNYPELIKKLHAMCDFFISNVGIARILYLYTGYKEIADVRNNLLSLIPIFNKYYKKENTFFSHGLLKKIKLIEELIPDTEKKIIDISTPIQYQAHEQQPYDLVKELTINSSYDITDLNYYPLIETLNILFYDDDYKIELINLDKVTNSNIKIINIFTNKFFTDNVENVFVKFNNLEEINIDIDDHLENCYIHNDNVKSIYIQGNDFKITKFEFKTPNVQKIMFQDIYFNRKYYFDRFLSDLKIETGNLMELFFENCGVSDSSPIVPFVLSSSHFKKIGRIKYLTFLQCEFTVLPGEKQKILKTLLDEIKRENNLEEVKIIILQFDYDLTESLFLNKELTNSDFSEKYKEIYDSLVNYKTYNSEYLT